jgi:hypothetical protein
MITTQELADFAANRINNKIETRVVAKRNGEFGVNDHVDFELDDATVRVMLKQRVSADFTVPASEVKLGRKAIFDKYAEPALESFFRTIEKITKRVTVSAPMAERLDQGIESARSGDPFQVIAYQMTRPNGDVRYGIETLFGTFNV